MKLNAIVILPAIALLLTATLGHAGQSEAPKQEKPAPTSANSNGGIGDSADAVRNYAVDKRDEAVKQAKLALEEIDARIKVLEERIDRNWDSMDSTARQQARNSLQALHAQRVRVAEWYGGLKNSTAGAWEHMKQGFSEAYQSLRHAWEKAEHDYRQGDKK